MKREIKFRAKSIDNSEWAFGVIQNDGMTLFPVSVYEKTICQFTGRHDKNGKEIYEGDILRHINGKTCQVLYSESSTSYVLVFVSPCIPSYDMGIYDLENLFEVIGNIYDNPELWED